VAGARRRRREERRTKLELATPSIEDEVMCVTCNVPLNVAEPTRTDQKRAEIRRLVARGLTKQQIFARDAR
jgi:hypothetical protein